MIPFLPLLALAQAASTAISTAPALDLHLMPSGVFDRVHGYAPFGLELTATRPATLRTTPDVANAAGATYGTIKLGTYAFLAMRVGDRLYVDSNANGDLTDDPATVWAETTYPNGTKAWGGSAMVDLSFGGATTPCRIGLYSTDKPDSLGYYADFALAGKAVLGGKSYDALYSDPSARWDGKAGLLMIDKDADGKFHPGYEFYRANEPFNVAGTTYETRGLSLVKSTKAVPEKTLATTVPEDPNLANGLVAGKAALPFRAKTTGGREISFPDSYKGKIVLVDFWATWCGPCMREVPNVVKNYRAYHDRGFEVLGVSLDRKGDGARVKAVTAEKGMTWDQIYDGNYFDAAIAKRYRIQAIPAVYLVDGDTGRILAAGGDARDAKLGPAIEKALAAKGR